MAEKVVLPTVRIQCDGLYPQVWIDDKELRTVVNAEVKHTGGEYAQVTLTFDANVGTDGLMSGPLPRGELIPPDDASN